MGHKRLVISGIAAVAALLGLGPAQTLPGDHVVSGIGTSQTIPVVALVAVEATQSGVALIGGETFIVDCVYVSAAAEHAHVIHVHGLSAGGRELVVTIFTILPRPPGDPSPTDGFFVQDPDRGPCESGGVPVGIGSGVWVVAP